MRSSYNTNNNLKGNSQSHHTKDIEMIKKKSKKKVQMYNSFKGFNFFYG